jgi:transposase-like protein
MSKDRTVTITCPICGEQTTAETGDDLAALNDWMEEYGWYKIGKKKYICSDCHDGGGE